MTVNSGTSMNLRLLVGSPRAFRLGTPARAGPLAPRSRPSNLPEPCQPSDASESSHVGESSSQSGASAPGILTSLGALSVLVSFPPESLSSPQAQQLFSLAAMDAETAATIAAVLGPFLAVGQLLMIVRIVLTWYPQMDTEKLPWILVYAPTEPVLGPTRKVIPPAFGVDVSPIVWVGLLSFINEVLLGPQGILNLIQRKA